MTDTLCCHEADALDCPRCNRETLRDYAENWADEPQQRLAVEFFACEPLRKAAHPWGCPCGHCVPSKWAELLHDLAELNAIRDGVLSWADVDEDDVRERVEYGLDVLAYGPIWWERAAA